MGDELARPCPSSSFEFDALPSEVIAEINHFSSNSEIMMGSASIASPWNLMAVCRSWHTLTTSTPSMWTSLVFIFTGAYLARLKTDGDAHMVGLTRRIDRCFRYAEPYPVAVIFSNAAHSGILSEFTPSKHLKMYLHRIESFHEQKPVSCDP